MNSKQKRGKTKEVPIIVPMDIGMIRRGESERLKRGKRRKKLPRSGGVGVMYGGGESALRRISADEF